jgi:CheY-like chemotaxis protein
LARPESTDPARRFFQKDLVKTGRQHCDTGVNYPVSPHHNPETPMDDNEPAPPPARGTLLYVEDHEDTRLATSLYLRSAGFDVCEAASTGEAMQRAAGLNAPLDVLIVDYHLGGEETGTEVAEEIGRKVGHSLPTIILTGDPANAEMPWLRNSPVWLVQKPASPATLVAGLWPLIEFRRAMRRLQSR